MTALSPAVALAWLGSLSVDLRSAAVLDADGAVLAGDAGLAARAATLPAGAEARDGDLVAVRSARRAVVADIAPNALISLQIADLRAAVSALGDG